MPKRAHYRGGGGGSRRTGSTRKGEGQQLVGIKEKLLLEAEEEQGGREMRTRVKKEEEVETGKRIKR